MSSRTVLLLESDAPLRGALIEALARVYPGARVFACGEPACACRLLSTRSFDLLLARVDGRDFRQDDLLAQVESLPEERRPRALMVVTHPVPALTADSGRERWIERLMLAIAPALTGAALHVNVPPPRKAAA